MKLITVWPVELTSKNLLIESSLLEVVYYQISKLSLTQIKP